MKKIFKIIIPYLFPTTLILFLLFSFNVFKLEYQFGYQSAHIYQTNFSWPKQIIFSELIRFKNKIFDKSYKTSFPRINIFISEQDSRKLLDNLPASTKKWVEAYINYPTKDIDFQEIRLRYRGDNPINWLNRKKQLKIKTKRNELIEGYRYFDYKIFKAEKYLPYFISKKMELVNQKYKLVEVYINGESNGLYFEQERIDETFLRKNKLMPTNVYKGENHATEYHIGLNKNLFNNPNIWKKLSIFNQENPSSTEDLKRFLKILRSNKYYSDPTLNDYIDIKYFSKFDALLTITNNVSHGYFHNMRLILDPWNGKITQLMVDPSLTSNDDYGLDFSSNDLGTFLNKNTSYIHEKYNWIYYYLVENDIVEKVKSHIKKIKKDLSTVQKKEPYDVRGLKHTKEIEKYFLILKANKKKFLNILNSNPKSSWSKNTDSFDISINDFTPLYNLKFEFSNRIIPEWIGIDLNYDEVISNNEPKFLINQNLKNVEIPIIFYSNRFKKNNFISTRFNNYEINYSNTYLRFISSNKIFPSKIKSQNFFNRKIFSIDEKQINNSVKRNISNNILFLNNNIKNILTLNGTIKVKENLILDKEVELQPGTTFLISPNKHIIFKKKVNAYGTKDQPIVFKKPDNQKKPWGSVVILGKDTKGSSLNNVIFSGGSGGSFNQYKFTSMFSIHDTRDIEIKNSDFSSNEFFDDTIHIIYSSNIKFINTEISNAYGDAIDVDISDNVLLRNIKVVNSNNDGLDFMESEAIVENLVVKNSKDKGVSIGENSKIIVKNSLIENNKIGAAVKDNSKAQFFKVNLLNNSVQLASYAKNWRYGQGGIIKIADSIIKAEENKFVTTMDPDDFLKKKDKNLVQNSKINLINSKIIGEENLIGENIFKRD